MLSGHISSSKTGKSNISYPIFLIYSMSFIATCCSYVFMSENTLYFTFKYGAISRNPNREKAIKKEI